MMEITFGYRWALLKATEFLFELINHDFAFTGDNDVRICENYV